MSRRAALVSFLAANAAAVASLAWPLILGAPGSGQGAAHAADAPLLVAITVPLLAVVAVREAGDGDARILALLGALVAVNSVLRIPKGLSGEGFMFILPILAGWWISGRFAFLLGAFSILTSALITGGVGPWLPFQMFGLGWVGLGAAFVRTLARGRVPVLALTVWAAVSSYAYGFVVTLWFWPFLDRTGTANPAVAFLRFYALTSAPWDTARALLSNVPLVALLARPVGRLLQRARDRFTVVYSP